MTEYEKHIELKEKLNRLATLKARQDYFTFLKHTFRGKKNPTWNWHHRYICNVLSDFILTDNYNRLMIFMPPQHQKSTMMTEFLPPFAFGINPDIQIILTMYNSTFASSYNRRIQRIIMSDTYKELFPNTKLNESNSSSIPFVRNTEKFEIVDRVGFLKSVGVGGGIAGEPGKIILMDDVIKNVEEGNSLTYRNKTYDWFTDEIEARLHNDSKIAFTITRRHEDDLAGRLIARDGLIEDGGIWKVIVVPAIKENNDNPDDIREIGEALFPELHSLERLLYRKEKSPRTFTSLYQQRPAPTEGNIIKKEYLQIIDYEDVPDEVFDQTPHSTVDTAFGTKENNDPSGMLYYYKYDNCLYLFDYFEKRLEFPDLLKAIEQKAKTNLNSKSKIYVEPKASGKSVVQTMKRATTINIVEYEMPSGSKLERITACLDVLSTKRVYLIKGHWNRSFIESCTVFPNGAHDEPVDTLGMAIHKEFLKEDRGRRSVTTVLGSYRPY